MSGIRIRTIRKDDNAILSSIVKSTLAEFGANHPGTVYFDPTTNELFELFRKPGSIYYVAEENNEVAGGGGIYPSNGLPDGTCELVKMYLLPAYRGKGIGKKLIVNCLDYAAQASYRQVYIESMPELEKALSIYEQFGFRYLDQPVGNTGHFGCSIWMLKELGNQ